MVEQFFDIIYSVHVEAASGSEGSLRGRAGKHCGQKRTYRAVADQYAFIPREAISKFLLYCVDCQRKNAGLDPNGNAHKMKSAQKTFQKGAIKTPSFGVSSTTSFPSTGSFDLPKITNVNSNSVATPTPINPSHLIPSGMNPTAACAALSQAVAAMQSLAGQNPFQSLHARMGARASLLSNALQQQSTGGFKGLLGSQVVPRGDDVTSTASDLRIGHQDNNGGSEIQPFFAPSLVGKLNGSIDLSLPITSTYLRRMRALGLGGYNDQNHGEPTQRSVSRSSSGGRAIRSSSSTHFHGIAAFHPSATGGKGSAWQTASLIFEMFKEPFSSRESNPRF